MTSLKVVALVKPQVLMVLRAALVLCSSVSWTHSEMSRTVALQEYGSGEATTFDTRRVERRALQ